MDRTSSAETFRERFKGKYRETDGCWEWWGSRNTNGYGQFWVGSRGGLFRAHRIAWELAYGPPPDDMLVCHRCDNRGCVRPDHLFLGTHQDNMRDMREKGRSPKNKWGGSTRCKKGLHEFTPENTRVTPAGARVCRACRVIGDIGRPRKSRATGRKRGRPSLGLPKPARRSVVGRPMVRTEYVDEDLMALLQSIFGSASNAHHNLSPYLVDARVSWWMFQRAFSKKGVEGKVVKAIQKAADEWIKGIQATIREQKRVELAEAGD